MEDGWIEWKGGECPLSMPRVELRYRDGDTIVVSVDTMIGDGSWCHMPENPNGDIVAYRMVHPCKPDIFADAA